MTKIDAKFGDVMDLLRQLEGTAFGMADGVICALGMVIGAAAATSDPKPVLLIGLVGGVADAFGNSIGFYISQSAERGVQRHDLEKGERAHVHTRLENILNGAASFIATILIFGVLVAPFALIPIDMAVWTSCILGVVMLALMGVYVANLSKENPAMMAFEYSFLGLFGAIVSYLVGLWLGGMLGLR
jgi:predicted membrane protein (TIGR00267 family)